MLVLVISLLFVGVVARLADLQVVDPGRYVAYGESQRIRAEVLPADRGSLLDRRGAELALSVPRGSVVADPRLVTDPARAAAQLAPLLGLEPADLRDRLSRPSRFEYLARQVDEEVAATVSGLAIPGVFLREEPVRSYPAGSLASSVLGSTDVDLLGVSGLELRFDDVLTGEPGETVIERSLTGQAIPVGERQLRPAVRGDDLELTIDRELQYVVEDAVADQIEAMGARGGLAVVSVPATGEILAMTSLEADPETGEIRPTAHNAAAIDAFAPGSALKLVTVAGSIEEGLSTPDRALVIGDSLRVGDHVFRDHAPHAVEPWSVQRILAESSNVGTITLARELGEERLWTYLDRFGFGRRTGLAFPGESTGLLRHHDDWWGSDIGGAAIGTGVSVTAVQLLAAYNAVANGGEYVAPSLVRARIDADGVRHPEPGPEPTQVVSAATSNVVADMLTTVVDDGTGHLAAVPGYEVAGKTGTAWKVLPDGSFADSVGRHLYLATFVGFVPADDPQVSVIVMLDQPRNAYSGGYAAAPAFSRIAHYALRMLGVPPTEGTGAGTSTTVGSGEDRVRAAAATAPDEVAAGGDADG